MKKAVNALAEFVWRYFEIFVWSVILLLVFLVPGYAGKAVYLYREKRFIYFLLFFACIGCWRILLRLGKGTKPQQAVCLILTLTVFISFWRA